MPSLTSLLPAIAPTLNLSTAALYERQRQLVRLKLLPKPRGRGPGSGAEATAENVAMLIVTVMATDNLSDTDDRVRQLAHAVYRDRKSKTCQLTGKTTFVDALAAVLAADKVQSGTAVLVFRPELNALIYYPKSRSVVQSEFGPLPAMDRRCRLQSDIRLSHDALLAIRHHLHKAIDTKDDDL